MQAGTLKKEDRVLLEPKVAIDEGVGENEINPGHAEIWCFSGELGS
jgi:hypothetical protein